MGWYGGTLTSNDFLRGRFDGLGCVYQVPDEQLLGLLDYYCDPTRAVSVESYQTMIGVRLRRMRECATKSIQSY